jgi:hypothetical protein
MDSQLGLVEKKSWLGLGYTKMTSAVKFQDQILFVCILTLQGIFLLNHFLANEQSNDF